MITRNIFAGGLVLPSVLYNTNKQNKRGGRRGTTKRSTRGRDSGSGSGRNSLQTTHTPPVVRYSPNVFGFPDRLLAKLRYSDIVFTTHSSGALAKQLFRLNSIHDPDYTGTGHQPLYHDTYGGVYDHYAVVSSRARITAYTSHASIGSLVGLLIDDDLTTSSTFQTLMEQSHGLTKLLTPLSGSASETTFNITWSAAKFLGIDPFSSLTYKTAIGANPSEESLMVLWSIPVDGSTTMTINWKVEIEYDVLFTELSTPLQS